MIQYSLKYTLKQYSLLLASHDSSGHLKPELKSLVYFIL